MRLSTVPSLASPRIRLQNRPVCLSERVNAGVAIFPTDFAIQVAAPIVQPWIALPAHLEPLLTYPSLDRDSAA